MKRKAAYMKTEVIHFHCCLIFFQPGSNLKDQTPVLDNQLMISTSRLFYIVMISMYKVVSNILP